MVQNRMKPGLKISHILMSSGAMEWSRESYRAREQSEQYEAEADIQAVQAYERVYLCPDYKLFKTTVNHILEYARFICLQCHISVSYTTPKVWRTWVRWSEAVELVRHGELALLLRRDMPPAKSASRSRHFRGLRWGLNCDHFIFWCCDHIRK